MRFYNCIGFQDKNEKLITFNYGEEEGGVGGGVRIKGMRTGVYLKASADDYKYTSSTPSPKKCTNFDFLCFV